MITPEQMPQQFLNIIDEQLEYYQARRTIQVVNEIPHSSNIPIQNQNHWLRIPEVVCVYVDIKGSTKLSAELHDRSTAGVYQLFVGTAVKLFNEFDSPYIDVRGDGVFSLFNQDNPHRALAAAVTFKTFAYEVFVPTIRDRTGLEVGSHIGIDQKTVLVKKLGFRRSQGRTDRQNEVWAGKPVNMASKLAALSEDNEILVSDRFFTNLDDDHALLSCGCPGGRRVNLWDTKLLEGDTKFDFNVTYSLRSCWCETHGREYCEALLNAD